MKLDRLNRIHNTITPSEKQTKTKTSEFPPKVETKTLTNTQRNTSTNTTKQSNKQTYKQINN